jgi:hypothetical protein
MDSNLQKISDTLTVNEFGLYSLSQVTKFLTSTGKEANKGTASRHADRAGWNKTNGLTLEQMDELCQTYKWGPYRDVPVEEAAAELVRFEEPGNGLPTPKLDGFEISLGTGMNLAYQDPIQFAQLVSQMSDAAQGQMAQALELQEKKLADTVTAQHIITQQLKQLEQAQNQFTVQSTVNDALLKLKTQEIQLATGQNLPDGQPNMGNESRKP